MYLHLNISIRDFPSQKFYPNPEQYPEIKSVVDFYYEELFKQPGYVQAVTYLADELTLVRAGYWQSKSHFLQWKALRAPFKNMLDYALFEFYKSINKTQTSLWQIILDTETSRIDPIHSLAIKRFEETGLSRYDYIASL